MKLLVGRKGKTTAGGDPEVYIPPFAVGLQKMGHPGVAECGDSSLPAKG
jgi:hypothetical protein